MEEQAASVPPKQDEQRPADGVPCAVQWTQGQGALMQPQLGLLDCVVIQALSCPLINTTLDLSASNLMELLSCGRIACGAVTGKASTFGCAIEHSLAVWTGVVSCEHGQHPRRMDAARSAQDRCLCYSSTMFSKERQLFPGCQPDASQCTVTSM